MIRKVNAHKYAIWRSVVIVLLAKERQQNVYDKFSLSYFITFGYVMDDFMSDERWKVSAKSAESLYLTEWALFCQFSPSIFSVNLFFSVLASCSNRISFFRCTLFLFLFLGFLCLFLAQSLPPRLQNAFCCNSLTFFLFFDRQCVGARKNKSKKAANTRCELEKNEICHYYGHGYLWVT